ncbi:MAG: ATP-binding cassette domain-containing protein [Kineosporiaceae bacterium]|nr:ATP-binding cassette domain-containing protein [Kineosporiaceae bacterium]MBK8076153.1 ATP-binding cassette domain-containing protein [Kineosporiaceae bacterium]
MLQTIDLTRRFGDLTAVDQVSLDVPDGTLTGFVGANGAGKTTTMRLITGVLGSHAGQVLWQGRPITAADRRRFGYMPEERGLYPKQPVLDQLIYLGRLTGLSATAARSRAGALLERFGLADRTRERVEKLSLGNQQRVQIIAAVIASPVALILDEPFSGLDPVAVEQMADIVREHAANGLPVLFSSHQLDLVERLCDRVAIMSRGRLITQGRVEDLRRTTTPRYRLALDVDAGWVRDAPGVSTLDVDGSSALIELDDPEASRHLLREALSRGQIREFSPVVPSLTELYKEVAA